MAHGRVFYNQIRSGGAIVKIADYTLVEADAFNLIVANLGSAITFTLPAASPNLLWKVYILNIGSGTLTVSRNGLNINGAASDLSIATGKGAIIFTDGTNYFSIGT